MLKLSTAEIAYSILSVEIHGSPLLSDYVKNSEEKAGLFYSNILFSKSEKVKAILYLQWRNPYWNKYFQHLYMYSRIQSSTLLNNLVSPHMMWQVGQADIEYVLAFRKSWPLMADFFWHFCHRQLFKWELFTLPQNMHSHKSSATYIKLNIW